MRSILLLLIALLAINLPAQVNTFTGGGDGKTWNDTANWSLGSIPTSSDDVVISNTDSVIVDSGEANNLNIQNSGIYLGELSFFDISGTVTIDANAEMVIIGGSAFIPIKKLINEGQIKTLGNFTTILTDTMIFNGGTYIDEAQDNQIINNSNSSITVSGSMSGTATNTVTLTNLTIPDGETFTLDISGGAIEFQQSCNQFGCFPGEISGENATLINKSNMNISGFMSIISNSNINFINEGNITINFGDLSIANGTFTNEITGIITFDDGSITNDNISLINNGLIQTINSSVGGIGPGITNDGSIVINDGCNFIIEGTVVNNTTGVISGTGRLTLDGTGFSMSNTGLIAPGNSPGTLTISGDNEFVMDAGSTYEVEINGTNTGDYDVIQLETDATLNGNINLVLGYAPTTGDQYKFISSSSTITQNFPSTLTADYQGDTYEFTLTQNGNDIDITSAGLLPVTLVTFEAKQKSNNEVLLHWATDTEVNNDYFDIEKSIDGINFTKIGRVQGAGNSNKTEEYFYTDSSPNAMNLYRLKQVDYDGSYTYSEVILLRTSIKDEINFSNIVAKGELLRINGKIQSISLFAQDGRQIYRNIFSDIHSQTEIPTANLTPGMYFININNRNTHKLVIK